MMIKKIFGIAGIAALLVLVVFATVTTSKFLQKQNNSEAIPFAQLIDDEEGDECTPETCGEEGEEEVPKCSKDTWQCGNFSACSKDGKQTRNCKLVFDCPYAKTPSPAEEQKCTPPPPPMPPPVTPSCDKDTWECAVWSACSPDGKQWRHCTLAFDCPTANTTKPSEERSCTPSAPPPPPPVTPPPSGTPPSPPPVTTPPSGTPPPTPPPVTPGTTPPPPETIVTPPTPETTEPATLVEEQVIRTQLEEALKTTTKETVIRIVDTTPAFKEIFETAKTTIQIAPSNAAARSDTDRDGIADGVDPDPYNADMNKNGVPDGVDAETSQGITTVDEEDIKLRTEAAVEMQRLVATGTPPAQAKNIVQKTVSKKRAAKKIEKIREVAKKKYNKTITKHTDDSNGDGIPDEVAIAFGVDPDEKIIPGTSGTAELKIYAANKDTFGKKCTTSIYSGMVLPTQGFTILASCPKNKEFTLYSYNKEGAAKKLTTKKTSENNKLVFVIEKNTLPEGQYLFQIKPANASMSFFSETGLASAIAADSSSDEQSDPVVVNLVSESEIKEPVVKAIEGVEVSGLRNIQVKTGPDGKVRVTGNSDIESTVVGTFSSAVFTSAILADVENGAFSVVSPQPLEGGDHEVVIYATRPEEGNQSSPVKLNFSIIPTAQAATTLGAQRPTERESRGLPVSYIALGVAAMAVIVGVSVAVGRKKKVP